jgi:hypothetical protein
MPRTSDRALAHPPSRLANARQVAVNTMARQRLINQWRQHGNRRLSADRRHQGRIDRFRAPRLDRVPIGELVAQPTRGARQHPHPAATLRAGSTFPTSAFTRWLTSPRRSWRRTARWAARSLIVAQVAQGVNGGDVMTESIGLKFSEVKWKYCQQKIGGGSAGTRPGDGMRQRTGWQREARSDIAGGRRQRLCDWRQAARRFSMAAKRG